MSQSRQPSIAREFWLILLSFFLPCVTVWIESGFFSWDFLVNVILLLLTFGFGASMHAIYIVLAHRYEPVRNGYTPVDVENAFPSARNILNREPCAPTSYNAVQPQPVNNTADHKNAASGNSSTGKDSSSTQATPAASVPQPGTSAAPHPGTCDGLPSDTISSPPPYTESATGAVISYDNKVQSR